MASSPQLKNIETISLSFNKINKIESNAFKGLIYLKNLILNNNKLEKIDSFIFKDLINLENLNLSFNKLILFETFNFQKLSILDLSKNQLISIQLPLSASKELLLNNNKIKEIKNGTFLNSTDLIKLNMGYNLIVRQ